MICRSCESNQVLSILSLGQMPLANSLLKKNQLDEKEQRYPLEIMLCEHCALVQLKETIPAQVLFNEYLYFSSNSETMLHAAASLVQTILPTLPKGGTIIEIASNDGYLLKNYLNQGFSILGIEPAKNIAEYANAMGIPSKQAYFSRELAIQLAEDNFSADIIHANNVMAHIENINDFVSGIKILLKAHGRAIIEVPYLLDLIANNEFDTIYHEHIYYFSLTALHALFNRHGLAISAVEKLAIHGGSLRLFITHEHHNRPNEQIKKLLAEEENLNIKNLAFYQPFLQQIHELKAKLPNYLQALKKQNKKIAAYGAAAKGTTLLNYFNISKEIIDFVVDRSSVKQGYYTPGTHLEIKPVDCLLKEKIDYTLLLTWNFAKEILHQQEDYRKNGGKFIIPIPEMEII